MKGTTGGGGVVQKSMRWIWRLYPRRYRSRFLPEMERDLHRSGSNGSRPGIRAVLDALITLPRAWVSELEHLALDLGGVRDGVRQGVRDLTRAPRYAGAVIVLLALAVGANTGIFSVAYATVLKTLPFDVPERLVSIFPAPVTRDERSGWRLKPEFEELVDGAALYIAGGGATLARSTGAERISLAQVTDGFFGTLGVRPLVGPGMRPGMEDERVAVLTHRLWVRAFGGDSDVIGTELTLNGDAYRIVGVMPPEAVFPAEAELWVSFPPNPGFFSGPFGPKAIARLRAGTNVQGLTEMLDAWIERDMAARPASARRGPPPTEIRSLRKELTGSVRAPLLALMGISALILLVGCFNLAGLVLARTAGREEEFAIRRAIGGERRRLFAQLLAEVLCLSLVAGLAGLLMAYWFSTVVLHMLPGDIPGLADVRLGVPVLLFAGGLTLAAGMVVGVVPALQGALVGGDRAHGGRSTASSGQTRLQGILLVAQVAVAVVLVVSATLLGGSLAKLSAVPLGYDIKNVLTFTVRLPPGTYPDQESQTAYLADLTDRLEAIPGVITVGATTRLPLRDDQGWGDYGIRRADAQEDDGLSAHWIFANRAYLDAMEIPVLEGSAFGASHEGEEPWSRVVLNASLARRLFGDAPAVGQRVQMKFYPGWKDGVVEAVVGDVFLRGPAESAPAVFLSDIASISAPWLGMALRTQGDPSTLVDAVRAAVLSVDPAVPGYRFATTGSAARRFLAVRRAVALLGAIFSGFALLVFSVGIAGLVSHGISRRRRELGVRIALGARRAVLIRSTVLRPLGLVALGLVIGLGLSLATGRVLRGLLFGLAPQDPRILAVAALVVILVAAAGAWLPAQGISRVDPAEAMRPD